MATVLGISLDLGSEAVALFEEAILVLQQSLSSPDEKVDKAKTLDSYRLFQQAINIYYDKLVDTSDLLHRILKFKQTVLPQNTPSSTLFQENHSPSNFAPGNAARSTPKSKDRSQSDQGYITHLAEGSSATQTNFECQNCNYVQRRSEGMSSISTPEYKRAHNETRSFNFSPQNKTVQLASGPDYSLDGSSADRNSRIPEELLHPHSTSPSTTPQPRKLSQSRFDNFLSQPTTPPERRFTTEMTQNCSKTTAPKRYSADAVLTNNSYPGKPMNQSIRESLPSGQQSGGGVELVDLTESPPRKSFGTQVQPLYRLGKDVRVVKGQQQQPSGIATPQGRPGFASVSTQFDAPQEIEVPEYKEMSSPSTPVLFWHGVHYPICNTDDGSSFTFKLPKKRQWTYQYEYLPHEKAQDREIAAREERRREQLAHKLQLEEKMEKERRRQEMLEKKTTPSWPKSDICYLKRMPGYTPYKPDEKTSTSRIFHRSEGFKPAGKTKKDAAEITRRLSFQAEEDEEGLERDEVCTPDEQRRAEERALAILMDGCW